MVSVIERREREVKRMNKKVLVAGIVFATVIMLFSMTPVLAAPKEKVDFALYIQGATPSTAILHANGYLVGSPDEKWASPVLPPPDGCAVWHYINAPFNPTNVTLVIDGTTIPYSRLVYTAAISGNINWLNDQQTEWKVDETVTIYTSSAKTTVWGTLEMRTVSHSYFSPTPTLGMVVGSFVGHGTGALEGVKVQGDCSAIRILGVTTRVRGGIAMGWP